MKKLHIATILISLVLFLNKNVQGEEDELIPSTMCPRFSVQEFYLSLFKVEGHINPAQRFQFHMLGVG